MANPLLITLPCRSPIDGTDLKALIRKLLHRLGANEGQFATAIRALAPDVQIHSIEPNPAAYERLIRYSRGDAMWTTHACALGRRSGRIALSVAASSAFSSCVAANP